MQMVGDVSCIEAPSVLPIAGSPINPDPSNSVQFLVEGERLVADRSLLSRKCTFFENMFRPEFRESIAAEVEMKNVNVTAMRRFLNYLNADTQLEQEDISLRDLFYLYQLSDMLLYTPLLKHVTHAIAVNTDASNCLEVLQFCHSLHVTDDLIIANAMEMAAFHFKTIVRTGSFLELDEEVVCSLLSRDDLVIGRESDVLGAAVRWSRHNRNNTAIFSTVRFYLIQKLELKKWYSDRKLWNSLIPLTSVPLFLDNRQRDSLRCLYVIGGKDQATVEVYNLRTGMWTMGKALPEARHSATAITLNSSVILMGGIIGTTTTSSVLMFRLDWDSWVPLPPMTTPRSGSGGAVLQGRVYMCGGRNGGTVLSSCEMFDPQTHSWNHVAPMNSPRTYHGLAATTDALYAVGGTSAVIAERQSEQTRITSLERYCPLNNAWSVVAKLSLPLMAPGCTVASGDRLYILGGRNFAHTMLSYRDGQFDVEKPMMVPRGQSVKVVTVGRHIYCVGGCLGFGALRSMERYDTVTKMWTSLAAKTLSQGSTSFTAL